MSKYLLFFILFVVSFFLFPSQPIDPLEKQAIIDLNDQLNLGWNFTESIGCNQTYKLSRIMCDPTGTNFIEIEINPPIPRIINGSILAVFSHLQLLVLNINCILSDMSWWANMTSSDYDFVSYSNSFQFPTIYPNNLRSVSLYNLNTFVPEEFFIYNKKIVILNHLAAYSYPTDMTLGIQSNLTSLTMETLVRLFDFTFFPFLEELILTVPDNFTYYNYNTMRSVSYLSITGFPTNTDPQHFIPSSLSFFGITHFFPATVSFGPLSYLTSGYIFFGQAMYITILIKYSELANICAILASIVTYEDVTFTSFDLVRFSFPQILTFKNVFSSIPMNNLTLFQLKGSVIIEGGGIMEPLPDTLCELDSFTLINTNFIKIPSCFFCSINLFPKLVETSSGNKQLAVPNPLTCDSFYVENSFQLFSTVGGLFYINGYDIGWHVCDSNGDILMDLDIPNSHGEFPIQAGTGTNHTLELVFHYETFGQKYKVHFNYSYYPPTIDYDIMQYGTVGYLDIIGDMFGTNASEVTLVIADVKYREKDFITVDHQRIRLNRNPMPYPNDLLYSIMVNVSGQSVSYLVDSLIDAPYIQYILYDLDRLQVQADYLTIRGYQFTFDYSLISSSIDYIACDMVSAAHMEIIIKCPMGHYTGTSRVRLRIAYYNVSSQLDPSIFVPENDYNPNFLYSVFIEDVNWPEVLGIALGCFFSILFPSIIILFIFRKKVAKKLEELDEYYNPDEHRREKAERIARERRFAMVEGVIKEEIKQRKKEKKMAEDRQTSEQRMIQSII